MTGDPEIDALYQSTLKPRLEALEGVRLELRGYIVKAAVCIGLPFALFFLSDVIGGLTPGLTGGAITALSFGLIFVGVLVAGFRYLVPGVAAHMNYRTRFKHEVAAEVFRIVCPTASYSPTEGVARAVFDDAGIFNTRGGYTSDDRVRGKIGATPFEAADVSRSYTTGGKNKRTVVVFRGLFFHLDFNKRLTGTTIVQPAGGSASSIGDRSKLTRVALEDPAFEAAFDVFASDEVEARYILTPAMMAQVLALATRTARPLYLGFKGHRAYLGVNYGRALFEPGIAVTTSVDAIHEMAGQFALAETVVHELDLNTRIWTKDVDESLLHTPAPRPDALEALAARGGVTATELWETAHEAADAVDGAEAVAAPAGTSIQVEHGAGLSVVRYRLSVGSGVAVLLSLVSGAVAAAAAPALPEALGMPELAGWTGWIPALPGIPQFLRDYPLPCFVGAAILFPFATLTWMVRVRRVEVTPAAVRISRGLRPWPRSYPRPPFGKVVRVDRAVFIGRTDRFTMVNASASPMLSESEARWVAAELRRALRSTAH